MSNFEIYHHTFDPGTVCLGGNAAPNVGSNYLVLVGPMVDLSLMPSHRVAISNLVSHTTNTAYDVAELDEGDTYYVDRDYIFGALPGFLRSLNGIRTANDDKTAPATDLEFLCFSVEEPVRVYILCKRPRKSDYVASYHETDFRALCIELAGPFRRQSDQRGSGVGSSGMAGSKLRRSPRGRDGIHRRSNGLLRDLELAVSGR